LWLCGFLALNPIGNTPILNLDLPPSLAPRVLNALKADPRTVDLRVLAPHFYELAARTLEFFEENEIVDVLSEVRRMLCTPLSCGILTLMCF
jgi:GINS complex subunit 3